MTCEIHPTAVVRDDVELGAGVTIHPYAVLYGPSVIGDGCEIGPHAVVHPFTHLGSGSRVHAGAVLGDTPQDLGFGGGDSTTEIGENCVIREAVTIHRGTKPGTATVIGDDCYLMQGSHVAHNCVLGRRVILVNNALLAGYVSVGDGAFLSGQTAVHQFCRVGRLAMMGGISAASQDVPPFCTTHPVTVNTLAGLNVVGMRRAGMGGEERKAVKAAFKTLFLSGLKMEEAVARTREEFGEGPASELADFVAESERGCCTPG